MLSALVIATGFEPVTVCLEGRCSIQLSYATSNSKMSGWQDSNLRPPRPKRGAITGLRYTPKNIAERKGFEPPVPLRVQLLSREPRSTTPAPLLFFSKTYAKELIFASANVTLQLHLHNIFLLFLTIFQAYLLGVFNS